MISALAFLACCGGAWAIDCKHARLPAQQVACSSPELMKILDERDRVFAQVRAGLKGKELEALVADERNWVKSYPKTCGVPAKGRLPTPIAKTTIACFKRASEERITYLRQYGKSKEAPAEPSESTASPLAPPAAAPKAVEESTLPPTGKAAPPPAATPPAGNAAPPEHAVAPAEQSPAAAAPPSVAAVPPSPAGTPPSPANPPGSATAPPPAGAPAATSAPPAEYHLKFTFACSNAGELPKVMSSLAANDLSYPLSRPDCLPVPDGGKASLLSVNGDIAKIRMCTADIGCTDVYIDANAVLDAEGHSVAK